MKRYLHIFIIIVVPFFAIAQTGDYPYSPVNFSDVHIQDAFWKPRQDTNRLVTIPFAFQKSKETGRLDNFKVAGEVNAGILATGSFCSKYGYDDSDVYKIIEGGAYSLTTHPDPQLEGFLDSLIADIASAQEPDGYLYTMRTINPEKSWATERWVNSRYKGAHELYNVGHMYEAAVAWYEATGKRTLLNVALKNADLLCETFGPDKLPMASGHQEIEIGLATLYRVTGEEKYLNLAKFFLDQRGKGEQSGSTYTQDHLPVVEQYEAVGHAVRATYMYSAMADIAALTGDSTYIRAIGRIWEDVVTGKIYLTGGIGSRSAGEAYGDRYELPNLTAYNETCAAIANIFWNYRMFLLQGDGKYIDVLERTLYNGMLSGISLRGDRFFYPNPLESEGDYARSEWFGCSCCPSNLARFIPSVSRYLYATRADTLFVNLFIGSKGMVYLKDEAIEITQETNYPWDGKVILKVKPKKPILMTIALRIPGWVFNEVLPGGLYHFADTLNLAPSLSINGKLYRQNRQHGYCLVTRTWHPGDEITWKLPMPIRKVLAINAIADDKNRVAFTRGPIVFCAEGIDNGGDVQGLIVSLNAQFEYTFVPDLLNGLGILTGPAKKLRGNGYSSPLSPLPATLNLLPYYAWNHRDTGQMKVWFYNDQYVFAPEMKPASSIFLDTLSVKLKQVEGQHTFYSTGDEWPDQQALEYTGDPIRLAATTTLAAVAYNREGKASDLVAGTFTQVACQPATMPEKEKPGLNCRYYEGRFRKVPEFDTLIPLKEGVVTRIDALAIRDTADAYGLVFYGFLHIPESGVYTFSLRSDDGARLLINTNEVALNDGLHEITEKTGQAALSAGYHQIRVDYFDYGSDEGLEIWVEGPGVARQQLPEGWLFH